MCKYIKKTLVSPFSDARLRTQIHSAVSTNNLSLLKTLLEDSSLNLGIIDDSTAELYMYTLTNLQSDSTGTYLELDEMLTAFSAARAGWSLSTL